MSLDKPNVVFVLGGPGAGKGTQCAKIVAEFGYIHLSAGELLRKERQRPGSAVGELIENHIREGTIVPVEITVGLLQNAILDSGKFKFLIDGFPRNQDNLNGWQKIVNDKCNVSFVLVFDCPTEVCVKRCLSRGETSGRSDDNVESLKHRIATFKESTLPIIEYYSKLGLVHQIDAGDRNVDEIYNDVKKLFQHSPTEGAAPES